MMEVVADSRALESFEQLIPASYQSDEKILPALTALMRKGRLHQDVLLRSASGALLGNLAPRLPSLPLLGFDEVWDLKATGGEYNLGGARARVDLSRMAWAFDCHFPGDPVLPGSLMLEALFQLVGLYGAARGFSGQGRAARMKAVRFLGEVVPSSSYVEYCISVRHISRSRQIIIADGFAKSESKTCMTASGIMLVVKSMAVV